MNSMQTPQANINHLDQLWFQVAGTRCNLECNHCFISCSPKNKSFDFLSLGQINSRLAEAVKLGVKEFYFTGGEPFINPQMVEILKATLKVGPATVLTNATVLHKDWLKELRQAEDDSQYCLEFRVSIDGFSAEANDPIRGEGTFDRAMRGVQKLVSFGFLPIITAVRTWPEDDDKQVIEGFVNVLKKAGYLRPRIKVLPTLQIGAEANRTEGYAALDRITPEMMEGFDQSVLVCHNSRIVTDRGVHVCPILIESPDSLMGQSLADSIQPFALKHGACFTCYRYGSICSNPTQASLEKSFETSPIERKLSK